MERNFAGLQKTHQENEKKIIGLKEENEKLKERIRKARALVSSKFEFLVGNLKTSFEEFRAELKQKSTEDEKSKSEIQERVETLAEIVTNL